MDNVFVLFAFVCLFFEGGVCLLVFCFKFCLNFIWVCFKVHTIIVKTFFLFVQPQKTWRRRLKIFSVCRSYFSSTPDHGKFSFSSNIV